MFLKHTLIYFLSKGLTGVVSFLAILIFTRFLEPDEYGRYSILISTVGILNILFLQWFRFGMARFYPEYIEQNKQPYFLAFVLKNLLIFVVVISLVTLLVSVGSSLYLDSNHGKVYAFIGLILLSQSTYDFLTQLFISELRPKFFSIANIMKSLIAIVISSILLWLGYSYVAIICGLVIGLGFAIVYAWKNLQLRQQEKYSYDTVLLKDILTYSLPLVVSSSMSFVLSSSNRFVIQHYWGDTEAGFFILGNDFADQTLGVLMTIVSTASFPIAMRIYASEGESTRFTQQMKNSLWMLVGIVTPAVVVFLTSYPDIINLFFGLKFRSVNPMLVPIVAISTFVLGVKSFFLDQAFYFKRETRYQTIILVSTALINFVLNLIFVPQYGYMACAYASLVSFTLATIATAIVIYWLMPLPIPLGKLLKTFLAATAMFIFLYFQSHANNWIYLVIKITSALLIYAVALAALEFRLVKEQLRNLLRSSRKM
jgi:O-antigen/teichoic acid export membrane protein